MSDTKKKLSIFKRGGEEVFPFLFYYFRKRKQMSEILSKEYGAINGDYKNYHQLSDEELKSRILEEQERAKALDEKTFKMTLSISIALTILGSATSFLVKGMPFEILRFFLAITLSVSIVYSLAAGFIAVGALKTMPSYGFGTDFIIKSKNDRSQLVHALVAQEKMNIIRHLRNESAYQCLRNGFICLFVALGSIAIAFLSNVIQVKKYLCNLSGVFS